jgi:hypothetical protein
MSQELKSSSERIGQLYPVLVDYYGNIIDGEHRLGADKKWKKVRVDYIKTEKDRLIARIVSNTVRRTVTSEEKTELLGRLGEIYFREGIGFGKIAYEIAEETGMSYQWVMKYLPDRFKDSLQSERAKLALRHRAGMNELLDPLKDMMNKRTYGNSRMNKLLDPPKDLLSVRTYGNTDLVNVMVKKPLYEQLKKKASKLEITLDKLIYNALLLILGI